MSLTDLKEQHDKARKKFEDSMAEAPILILNTEGYPSEASKKPIEGIGILMGCTECNCQKWIKVPGKVHECLCGEDLTELLFAGVYTPLPQSLARSEKSPWR